MSLALLGVSVAGDTGLDKLSVTGATELSTLTTSGAATLASASVTGSTNLSTLTTSGAATLASASVTGDTSLSTLTTSGAATLASASVTGDTTLSTLTTSGAATLASASVTGDTTLSTLTTSGAATLASASVTGATSLSTATISGTTVLDGIVTCSSTLNVNTLNVSGSINQIETETILVQDRNIQLASNTSDPSLFNAGGITLGTGGSAASILYTDATSSWDLNKGCKVTGNTTLSTLTTSAAATLASAEITTNATVAGTLGVTGVSTLSGNVVLPGTSTLTVTGTGLTSLKALTTGGVTTLGGSTSVTGANTFAVGTGLTTLNGGLTVAAGTATLSGNVVLPSTSTLTVTGTGLTSLKALTTAGITTLGGNTSVNGTLAVTGDTDVGSLTIAGTGSIEPALNINGNGTLVFGAGNTKQCIDLIPDNSCGIGFQANTMYFRFPYMMNWYQGGTHSGTQGNAGGGIRLMNLSNTGALTVTSVSQTSDYRVKQNVVDVEEGLEKVLGLRPVTFEFKKEVGVVRHGFIAHEVEGVIQDAVTGEKDATDDTGDVLQTVDMMPLVSILTKGLQQMHAQNEILKERVSSLESQVAILYADYLSRQ